MIRKYLSIYIILMSSIAHGHIGPKKVMRISFDPELEDRQWVVIQNLGLFLSEDESYRWLCDEAMTSIGGLSDVVWVSDDRLSLLAGDSSGLFRSEDGGCQFSSVGEPFTEHRIAQIQTSLVNPQDVFVSTGTLGRDNGVFHSTDGGSTWRQVDIQIDGRVRRMLRSERDPHYLYVIHADGGWVTIDGGLSFSSMQLELDGQMLRGVDFDLLHVSATDPRIVYAAVSGFPASDLVVSEDGGQSWRRLTQLMDIPDSLAIGPDGSMVVSMPVGGLIRSIDGGVSWEQLASELEEGWISCLTFGPDGHLWGCVQRHPDKILVNSRDLGDNWENIIGLELNGIMRSTPCRDGRRGASACDFTCADYVDLCDESESDSVDSSDAGASHDAQPSPSPRASSSSGCAAVKIFRDQRLPQTFEIILTTAFLLCRRRRGTAACSK
ncbi:MAG: WD40/YVTN/BNR-like repeat-containing protein [Bradymonadia bacterium]